MTKKKKVSIIAGGAGFIGVNLAKKLLSIGNEVVIGDDLSLGSKSNVVNFLGHDFIDFLEIDLSTPEEADRLFDFCIKSYGRIDEIWHLAANSDIPAGVDNSDVDFKDTFLTTYVLLNTCKKYDVKIFNFASSSAVYGDWGNLPLQESLGPLKPISNYGAMKLASEAQICASAESFLSEANIFRFPNVVGTPATHGVILDFLKKLENTPLLLDVLGNGTQKKSYLHVEELVDAMIFISYKAIRKSSVEIINIGCSDNGIYVKDIAEIVRDISSPKADINYGDSNRGWLGDVPKFSYDISYLKSLGYEPKYSSKEAVKLAAENIFVERKLKK